MNDATSILSGSAAPLPAGLPPLAPIGGGFGSAAAPRFSSAEAFLDAWLAEPSRIGAYVGLGGHGETGCFFNYALATPGLAMFLRRRLDAGSASEASNRATVAATLQLARRLVDAQGRAGAASGKTLAVLDDDFGRHAWGWLATDAGGPAALEASRMPLVAALAALHPAAN